MANVRFDRRILRRGVLLGCSALAAGAVGVPAFAQDAADGVNADEIIVTARRVEERLQDVPISITVYSQEDLTKRNIAIPTDLVAYTPSLSVNQRFGPEKASFALRGFNQNLNTAPTVGVYFAEVVGVRAQGGNTSGNTVGAGAFTDLENVQVLKGPQGTLFGRNTTGGAILLTPRKPGDQFGGYVEGTYGNYDQKRLQGAINIPLADTFKIRIAAERNKRDGYMKNRAGVGADDYNDVNYFYGRFSMLAELTPTLENYTVAHYSRSKTHGFGARIVGCANETTTGAPGSVLNSTPGTAGFSAFRFLQAKSCEVQLARQNARGDGPYDVEIRFPDPMVKLQQWQIINTTTWQASDNLTVKNIMSYGEFRERTRGDLGGGNFVVPNINGEGGFNLTRYVNPALVGPGGAPFIVPAGTPYDRVLTDSGGPNANNAAESTFTEELQLQGETPDGRFNFVVGGYLEFSRPIGYNTSRTGIFVSCTRPQNFACTNPLAIGTIGESKTKFNFDNHGVFGQGTFNITDQLALTGGVRWTFDKITVHSEANTISLSTAAGSYIDPRTGVSIRRTCQNTLRHPGVVVQQVTTPCDSPLRNSSNEPTWVVNLDYKLTPDMMVYAKYARGYRQGGITPSAVGLETWQPEKMDSYEVGAKASFRGAVSGYFNVAGFYNNLSDQQIYVGLVPTDAARLAGFTGGSSFVLNAAKARSYGVEVDASALLFDSLRLSAGYTYLNTKVKDVLTAAELAPFLVGTPFASATPTVAAGTEFPDAPKHKLTLTGSYTLPLPESVGDLSIGATYVYTSTTLTNISEPRYVNGFPVGITPSSSLLNVNLDWKSVGGSPIDLALFATNVTKEVSKLPNQQSFAASGVAEVAMSPPRMYGLRVRYNFGD